MHNDELQNSLTGLIQRLVRSPSQAGIDSIDAVASTLCQWCASNGVGFRLLEEDGRPQGVLIHVAGATKGPRLLLNACLDTAAIGDVSTWDRSPISGEVCDGWIHGRGSADSKAGVAIFAHVAAQFARVPIFAGELLAYFDGDEHTGRMQGIRTFLDKCAPVDWAMIGYPGRDKVMIGARGFLRCRIVVHGVGSHSGAKSPSRQNAILKAARLVSELSREDLLPVGKSGIQPKLTVTAIEGGGDFGAVPDTCAVSIDVRLTREFPVETARCAIAGVARRIDELCPAVRESKILEVGNLPAYCLQEGEPLSRVLTAAAQAQFGEAVRRDVCGPSNVGNLLCLRGVPATCGFGVRYKNLHAPNECAFLPDVVPVFRAYESAVESLLGGANRPPSFGH